MAASFLNEHMVDMVEMVPVDMGGNRGRKGQSYECIQRPLLGPRTLAQVLSKFRLAPV
jgi:hypothetical protein